MVASGRPCTLTRRPEEHSKCASQLQPAVERHEEFVEVPRAKLPAPTPESSSVGPPERSTPLPDRLVGDRDATLGEEVFDIPETQG